jgi:hypothetical protein
MTVELIQAIGQYIVMPLTFVAAIYIVVKWL